MAKPWAKYEVDFINHDKFKALPGNAICLWIEGKNYADDKLTDGLLPEHILKRFRFYSKKNVEHLSTSIGPKNESEQYAPLWEAHAVGFKMHDYLEHNDGREAVEARIEKADGDRDWDRRRKQLQRNSTLTTEIRRRDGDACRYCGRAVQWHDRRGPDGGTYDHVEPRGDNSPENVVVACRGCNSVKGNRTPQQAGMVLRSVGDLARPSPNLVHRPNNGQVGLGRPASPEPEPEPEVPPNPPSGGPLGRIQRPADIIADDVLSDQAGAFLGRYVETYARVRHGAHLQLKPVRDFAYALELVDAYRDVDHLLKMAELFFLKDAWKPKNEPGTVGQFKHMAPQCDSELRRHGIVPGSRQAS